ncbi:MAG: hypothetical protein H7321_04155 [Bacteroidia bacterium]|nr:hypothetical protein [Bacteroidia bacterium]
MIKCFIPSLLLFICFEVSAQNQSFSITTGYNFGINTKSRGVAQTTSGSKSLPYSLGSGTVIEAGYKNELDSHFYIGFGINYLTSNNTLIESVYLKNGKQISYTGLSAWQFRASFSVGYHIYLKSQRLFFNIGLIAPFLGKIKQEKIYTDSAFSFKSKSEIRNMPAIGFTGTIGTEIKLINNINALIGIRINILNIKMRSEKITEYSDSKNNTLNEVFPTVYDREIRYLNNLDNGINDKKINPKGYDNSKPRETLTSRNAFSSLGLTFGIAWHF